MHHHYFLLLLPLFLFSKNTIAQNAQAGGYDHKWADYPAGEFDPLQITFDTTGLRHVYEIPAAGVHPRVYFGPSEIPDMKTRLTTTTSGQEVMKQIHAYTTLLHLGYVAGGYNHNADYGKDAFGNRRIDNAGYWDSSSYYEKLMNGDLNALVGADTKRKWLLSSCMALEAFECLINEGLNDPDTGLDYDERAEELGKAMSIWAQIALADPDLNWQNYNLFGGANMALAYDLNYNKMTTNQRDSVRMGIAEIIPTSPRYGSATTPYATTSNWCGLNSFEIITNLCIEDETGYNSSLTHDWMRAYRSFLSYGWYASGTPYEGMGKNYQFVCTNIAVARRGYSLLGHPHVKSYGQKFLPAITQPFGNYFTATDVWGGSGWDTEEGGYKFHPDDAIGLKWLFPNDENVDFIWKNYINKYYKLSSTGYVYQSILPCSNGYNQQLLLAAIFSSDYAATPFEEHASLALDSSLSFFAPERGLAVLRSGYDENALQTHFHCRQDMGGHTHGDRNSFTLSGLGRIWIRYTYGSTFQQTQYHSCMMIDSLGIHVATADGKKSRQPGRVLSFKDSAGVATITGDATYAYSWEWNWQDRPVGQDHSWLGTDNWTEVTETWNDFRYQQGSEFYHDLPFYEYASWDSPNKFERMIKRPYNPMERVYRSATMVQGDNPYLLIVDDVQKDADEHLYQWLAQIANDLFITETYTNFSHTNYRNDIILSEPNGNRKLLVRVLNNNGQCGDSLFVQSPIGLDHYAAGNALRSDANIPANDSVIFTSGDNITLQEGFQIDAPADFHAYIQTCDTTLAKFETFTPGINGNSPITRLVVEANTVAPDFRIMLFPFVDGTTLPVTNWNATKDTLEVNWGMYSESFGFEKTDGLTKVEKM